MLGGAISAPGCCVYAVVIMSSERSRAGRVRLLVMDCMHMATYYGVDSTGKDNTLYMIET